MSDLVAQIKKNLPDLRKSEIEGILYLILSGDDLTNTVLIQKTGLPKETIRQFKSSIGSLLDVGKENEYVSFTQEAKELVQSLAPRPHKWSLLSYADMEIESKLTEIREKYSLVPKRELDQFFATVKTSVAKAKVLQDKGMISGKRIALLGDDDLVSVVLGIMDTSYEQITVFDVDDDILTCINQIAGDFGLKNITTYKYDARIAFSGQQLNSFDVAMTDPPYTKTGIKLFLARCLELTKQPKDASGPYIFLAYGNSFKTPEKALKVQEVIHSTNLLVEDKIDKFNVYSGAESIGSSSSLYILKKTKFSHIPDNLTFESIYTFEEPKMESFPYVDHVTCKLHDVPANLTGSKKPLLRSLNEFCERHRLKIVDTKITNFKPFGTTVTFVLSNSNLVVHTWPEHRAVHIDLITCKPVYNKSLIYKNLSELFSTNFIEVREIE